MLLLDKPPGITSHTAVQTVRRLFGAAKAGHTGTLDPLATGLLPVCLGEATKFSHLLLEADKTYPAAIRLGVTTTTGDLEGEVTARVAGQAVTREEVEHVLQALRRRDPCRSRRCTARSSTAGSRSTSWRAPDARLPRAPRSDRHHAA